MATGDTWGQLRGAARPLHDEPGDYDELIERVGSARMVLLGPVTHGSRELFRQRALITQRLIAEKGFAGVAADVSWADACRIDHQVRGDGRAVEALQAAFGRFPQWPWRNREVLDFLTWLENWNKAIAPDRRAGFWGLDLYGSQISISEAIAYLDQVDPKAAARARERFASFEEVHQSDEAYALAEGEGVEGVEDEVVAHLVDLQHRRTEPFIGGESISLEERFHAEAVARHEQDAQIYYRALFRGRVASWSLRESHLADTLDSLLELLHDRWEDPRLVVWAHASHVGDARCTELHEMGELTLGQLARERHGAASCLVVLSTFVGRLTTARGWDEPIKRERLRPGISGSHEAVMSALGLPRVYLPLRDNEAARALSEPRLARTIGVIYRPGSERTSHYFETRLAEQFDEIIHIDETDAVDLLYDGASRKIAPEDAMMRGA